MFPGSHEMLVRQNQQLDKSQPVPANEDELLALEEEQQQLVRVADNARAHCGREPCPQPPLLSPVDT